MVWGIDVYIELNPEFNGNRDDVVPLPINDGDVPALLPPPLVPNDVLQIFFNIFYCNLTERNENEITRAIVITTTICWN